MYAAFGRGDIPAILTFDDSGKVTRFTDFLDTLADAAAWDVVQAKR